MSKQSDAIIRQVKAGKNTEKSLMKAKKLVEKNPDDYPELVELLDKHKGVSISDTKESFSTADAMKLYKELEKRVEKLEKSNSKKK